jgi:hypothetical protein
MGIQLKFKVQHTGKIDGSVNATPLMLSPSNILPPSSYCARIKNFTLASFCFFKIA